MRNIVREMSEEFTVEHGELKLVKRKVVNRAVPPDIAAVKMLPDSGEPFTDEQLEVEKQKLLNALRGDKQ